jgi:hypothetical protein
MAQTSTPESATFRSETAVVNGIRLHYLVGGNPHGKPRLTSAWFSCSRLKLVQGHASSRGGRLFRPGAGHARLWRFGQACWNRWV